MKDKTMNKDCLLYTSPFSKTLNLVMVCEPVEDIKPHDYEAAVRMAGFRVAAYICLLYTSRCV